MEIINWRLIGNPVNWIIVGLILLLGGFAAHSFLPYFTRSNNN